MRLIPGLRPPTVRSSNPVDAQHLARDERAQRTCEHFDDARDFVHGGDAVQRACFRHSFLIHRARSHEPSGAGVAGGDAIHGDVVGAELAGEAARVMRRQTSRQS